VRGPRPADDLALLCRSWPGVDLDALRDGYGDGLPDAARIRLALLRMLIGYAAHHIRIGWHDAAADDLAELRRLLAVDSRPASFGEKRLLFRTEGGGCSAP
jgi:hypothetical protein